MDNVLKLFLYIHTESYKITSILTIENLNIFKSFYYLKSLAWNSNTSIHFYNTILTNWITFFYENRSFFRFLLFIK